jgi:hypothetical protein
MRVNIVKKIIDGVDGQIKVSSHINQGSEFTVKLNRYLITDTEEIIFKADFSQSYRSPVCISMDMFLKKLLPI